jgi:stage II sporulation protein P
VALRLLQSQLAGGWNASGLPVEAALVIGQSPVLRSNQDAVRNLLRTEEDDDSGLPEEPAEDAVLPGEPAPPAAPVTEEPAETELPLVFADNGVTARTLVPSTPSGYVVTGDVYIDNRTDQELDAGIFDETFAAALSEEEGPQVLIVHTHGSEAYTMPPGQEYEPSGDCRTTDCNYNVVRVGDELARVLEETGICVLHDPTLHDYPEYSGAYGRSLDAVEKAMAEHPSISIVLDVHRDAISDGDGNPYKVISNVAGLNIAQMSMVIGTDGGGLDHPEWRENLKLAAAVQQKLADSYPTLMRPITVRNSRYNQHVTPGALLVEMGAAGNSLDEALVSARLFGAALAETLKGK